MRRIDWTDYEGRRMATWIPDDAPDSDAERGIAIGPQPLDALGLTAETELRLHNELHARGILTADDLRTRRGEAIAAIAAALKLDVIALERAWSDGHHDAPFDPGLAPRMQSDYVVPASEGGTRKQRAR